MKTPDSATPQVHEEFTCERCGRYGALEMGDQRLCPDCVQEACSCCLEFEKEDKQPKL